MKKKVYYITIATILTILTACGNDSNNSDSSEPTEVIEEVVPSVVKNDQEIKKALKDAHMYEENESYEEAISLYLDILSKDDRNEDAYFGLVFDYLYYLNDGETAEYYYNLAKEKVDNFAMIGAIVHTINETNKRMLGILHDSILRVMSRSEFHIDGEFNPDSISKYYKDTDFNSITKKDGFFEEKVLSSCNAETGADEAKKLHILGENDPHIYIKIISENEVDVWVPGHNELNWDN